MLESNKHFRNVAKISGDHDQLSFEHEHAKDAKR